MRTLKIGSHGQVVHDLKARLKAWGYGTTNTTNVFDEETLRSVKLFQNAQGLGADGIVGPKTWSALSKEPPLRDSANVLATYGYVGPNGTSQGRTTVIDEETALWLARMCVGEGGDNCSRDKASAMMWALMNRWFLHPAAKSNWASYLCLMRRFSQPINPRWQEGGDLATKNAGTELCTPARLARRAQICALAWDQIPSQIVEAVRAFQEGRLPPPAAVAALEKKRISNWASHDGLAEKYPWGVSFDRKERKDWFFEDNRLIKGCVVVSHF